MVIVAMLGDVIGDDGDGFVQFKGEYRIMAGVQLS